MRSSNPYQPTVTVDDREHLVFAGEIKAHDYAQLLYGPNTYEQTQAIKATIAIAIGLQSILLAVIVVKQMNEGEFPAPDEAMWYVLLAATELVSVVFYFCAPSLRKTIRIVKQNQDLLCPASGELNLHGLVFYDGVRTHWLSPAALIRTECFESGIRIPVADKPNRFLALAARLFDGYNVDVAQRLIDSWKASPRHNPAPSTLAGNQLWLKVSRPPDNAIEFNGHLTMQPTLGASAMVQHQQGWISDQEIAWANELRGCRTILSAFVTADIQPTQIDLRDRLGYRLTLMRDHLANDEAWQRVVATVSQLPNLAATMPTSISREPARQE